MDIMSLSTDPFGHYLLVSVAGEIDLHSAPALDVALLAAIRHNGAAVILDLSGITFMAAQGVTSLIRADLLARQRGGLLRLVGLPERVVQVLDLTGLEERFAVFGTAEEAAAEV